eukprot:3237358-Alexandrium_andersonii.AAC.1
MPQDQLQHPTHTQEPQWAGRKASQTLGKRGRIEQPRLGEARRCQAAPAFAQNCRKRTESVCNRVEHC